MNLALVAIAAVAMAAPVIAVTATAAVVTVVAAAAPFATINVSVGGVVRIGTLVLAVVIVVIR